MPGMFSQLKKQEQADEADRAAERHKSPPRHRPIPAAKALPVEAISTRATTPAAVERSEPAVSPPALPTATDLTSGAPRPDQHASATAPGVPILDLADYPTKTVTFPVTDHESLVLDELKLAITRTYQPPITATKERLLRLAIHQLVDDFRRNGQDSFAVTRLTKRPK